MVNTPIPHSLKSEAKKAAKILKDFTIPSAKVGPDKLIPVGLIINAKGLAILTVAKLGFLVTARGGSGIVIAKLDDGSWSAPSAIGIAGLGGGLEIGAEVTDFVIILTKQSAVEAFSKGGNLTLGGNFTIAAGPLGRNVEGDVALRSPAAIYTYSKTKGLFAGVSVEGSALIERKDANRKFYGEDIRAYAILGGEVDPPPECFDLYDVLEQHDKMFTRAALAVAKREAIKEAGRAVEGKGVVARVMSMRKGLKSDHSRSKGAEKVSRDAEEMESPDSSPEQWRRESHKVTRHSSTASYTKSKAKPKPRMTTSSSFTSRSVTKTAEVHAGSHSIVASSAAAWDSPPKGKALWAYQAQMPCDLSFEPGDDIIILTRTGTQDDWWEGSLNGRIGIFPANYVSVVN